MLPATPRAKPIRSSVPTYIRHPLLAHRCLFSSFFRYCPPVVFLSQRVLRKITKTPDPNSAPVAPRPSLSTAHLHFLHTSRRLPHRLERRVMKRDWSSTPYTPQQAEWHGSGEMVARRLSPFAFLSPSPPPPPVHLLSLIPPSESRPLTYFRVRRGLGVCLSAVEPHVLSSPMLIVYLHTTAIF
ncbi:hypothetical protein BKA81DRAFT_196423 [Phyllosticta paracitricarpa]